MEKSGPNPLSPYRYDFYRGIPVETTDMMLQQALESGQNGTEYDKKQDKSIKKNEKGVQANSKEIQKTNKRVTDIENLDDDFCTKSEMQETVAAAVAGKADKSEIPSLEDYYKKEEVDAMLLEKENEIYNLTKLIGDMGGNVTYDYPNEAGKSLATLMNNNGTVKMNEDTTINRIAPGIFAKNKVNLNLNNHTLTSTSAGNYGAIMARGTQVVTIYGKGSVEAGNGICIEANSASCVINLTGSTTTYHNNRNAELIYCYAGTINISGGIFKNDIPNEYVLNCYDANYKNGTAKIIVTGGKFYNFNPADCGAEGAHTSFVAEGYTVVESTEGEDTVYTVKKA